MHRHREHIDRCQAFCFVSVCGQILQISCQCRGIAADVDDSFRLHFDDGLKQGFIAAFSWRIDYDHIGFDVFGFVFVRQDFFCFANIKLCILDAVSSGIVFRICDGRRHNLYAVNLFCFLCKEQGDGSDAAVEIPYGLFTGQSCVFQCFSVKLFGLYRVDLIKRQRGNAVFDVSDIIFDIILTPDRLDFFSEDHICLLSVDICHDCGHALDLLKPVHQFFNLWNLSAIDHEADHQFFCGKSLADQYVTHQPFSGLFIIWLYFTDFHPRNDFV